MKRHNDNQNQLQTLGLERLPEEIALEVIAIVHTAIEKWAKGVTS